MKCFKATIRNKVLNIAFSGYLEARNLKEAQVEILKRMKKSPKKVCLELREYEKMDFTFVQLLIAIKKELEVSGVEFEFKAGFNESDQDLLNRLNLLNLLQTKSEEL